MPAEHYEVDLTSFKDSLGVDRSLETITYNDLRQRRELIQRRMREHSEQRSMRRWWRRRSTSG